MNMHDCCAPAAKKQNGHYDLAVLGAGSAGFSAAITAAELGANVALIGHGTIGGTCVNIGCRAVSFERKTAAVTYDDKRATLAALTAATTNAGYPSHQAR